MRTKILLESRSVGKVIEDMKLEVVGSPYALENLLLEAMDKSEPFYEVLKGAVNSYEERS